MAKKKALKKTGTEKAGAAKAPAKKTAGKEGAKKAAPAVASSKKPTAKAGTKSAPEAAKDAVKKVAKTATKALETAAHAVEPAVSSVVKPAIETVKKVAGKVAGKNADAIQRSTRPAPSSKPVFMKMGFRAGEKAAVIAAPRGFTLPASVEDVATLNDTYEFILLFVETEDEAKICAESLKESLTPKGRVWIAWPKGGASDLNRDRLAGIIENHGLSAVSNVALDERWSALKFMYPKDQRK